LLFVTCTATVDSFVVGFGTAQLPDRFIAMTCRVRLWSDMRGTACSDGPACSQFLRHPGAQFPASITPTRYLSYQ
jgi:hypothetical protein